MLYIRAAANISPQKTFENATFPAEIVGHEGNRLTAIAPDYKAFIDPKLIRRMSRVIKMGVASALQCLQNAGVALPDAITVGTAYGCIEDTAIFLRKMVEREEQQLTPTSFIQSTHNTIGAQVALLLQCRGYNNTFVNGGSSFEHALIDAQMMLQEGAAKSILVGGVDELTDDSFNILQRFGLFRQTPVSTASLYQQNGKGTIAGEGAAFFLLEAQSSGNDLARLDGLTTFYKPGDFAEVETQIQQFLSAQNISLDEVDLVILGDNGDIRNDAIYQHLQQTLLLNNQAISFKHLCGEYPTASAFALWYAATIIKAGNLAERPVKNVLIYNHYQNTYHSLMLLSAC